MYIDGYSGLPNIEKDGEIISIAEANDSKPGYLKEFLGYFVIRKTFLKVGNVYLFGEYWY